MKRSFILAGAMLATSMASDDAEFTMDVDGLLDLLKQINDEPYLALTIGVLAGGLSEAALFSQYPCITRAAEVLSATTNALAIYEQTNYRKLNWMDYSQLTLMGTQIVTSGPKAYEQCEKWIFEESAPSPIELAQTGRLQALSPGEVIELTNVLTTLLSVEATYLEGKLLVEEIQEGNYLLGGLEMGKLVVGGSYAYLSAYNWIAEWVDFP